MSLKHAGDVPSVNVYHETRIPERIVKLGCNINLHKNSPKVSSVIWTKDGKKIDICGSRGKYTGGSIADPSLTINAVNSTDKGEYKCCVSNSVGHNWSESILLGPPTVELDNPKIDRTHGTATYIATIKSIPSAMEAEWKVKEVPTGNYKTIDISDPFYGGSTVSMPHPKLIRHGYKTDHLQSYELEVSNFIGRSRRNTEDVTKNISHSNIERGILSDSGLMYVATRLGAEWSLVAFGLELNQAEIDQIKLDNPYSTHTQINTALRQWRDRRGDQTNNTLMQQLFDTLETCDRTDLVEVLREKYDIPGIPEFGSKSGCVSTALSGSKFTPGTSDDSVKPSGFKSGRRQGNSTPSEFKSEATKTTNSRIRSQLAIRKSESKSHTAQQDLQLEKMKINPKIRDFSLEKWRTNLTHQDLEKVKTNQHLDSHLGKSEDKSKTPGFAFGKSATIDTSSSAGFKFESGNELGSVSSGFSFGNNNETSSAPNPGLSFGPGNGSTTADGNKGFLFAPTTTSASLFGLEHFRRPAQADAIGGSTQGQMERPFLDEARFTANIHTGYRPYSVSCVSEERVWTRGTNNTMQLLTVQDQLLSSVQTKSGKSPHDITVTREGDLVYTDPRDNTINLVKDNKIRTLITLQGWIPLYVCCTAANHLLVTMVSDDRTQSKVVRYSGSTETQTIQYDVRGRPLYSSAGHSKYISENRNLDICVADWSANAVVVVNQSGTLRFRYTGHPSNTGPSFDPVGIATDSHSHILIADINNGRIHILDQDGQFLRYIHNLQLPRGLCVDSRDNLFVAEEGTVWGTGKVKKIQYLESQC